MGKVALRHVLKNFLNHFETLESRRRFNHEDDLYQKEFQSLKELTEKLKKDADYLCGQGLEDVNRKKNRYKDILPYDHSRVILSDYPGVIGSDFINANYVRGSTGSSCAYIAAQGPLPNTVIDFWRMIWECEVTVIVMACNKNECECYWPLDSDQRLQYGNISVSLVKWKQVCPEFLVRTLKIESNEEERVVCQFHYTTWPDHGVPHSVGPILELVRLIRDVQASEARPILVHCSAGCGRTGTICSIDYVWALLRTGKLTEDFSLYTIIRDMRRQRIAMVQTQEQYVLCYRAVAALFEQQLKMIDAHIYENLNADGEPLSVGSDTDDDAFLASEQPLFDVAARTRVSMSSGMFANTTDVANDLNHLPMTSQQQQQSSLPTPLGESNRFAVVDDDVCTNLSSDSEPILCGPKHARTLSSSSMFGQLSIEPHTDSPDVGLLLSESDSDLAGRENNRQSSALLLDSDQSEQDNHTMEHKSVAMSGNAMRVTTLDNNELDQTNLADNSSSNDDDRSSCCSDSEAILLSSSNPQSNRRVATIQKYGTISGAFARSMQPTIAKAAAAAVGAATFTSTSLSSSSSAQSHASNRPRLLFGSLRQTAFHKSTPNFISNAFDVCDNVASSNEQMNGKAVTSINANGLSAEHGNKQQEKLVGKATVIRRPSIAKLKAMFENMSSLDSGFREPINRSNRRKNINLQRSMSTREQISHCNNSNSNNNWSSGNESAATTDTIATDDDSARASRSTDTLERRASLFGLHVDSSFEQLSVDALSTKTCSMWSNTNEMSTNCSPSDPNSTSNQSEVASYGECSSDLFERKEITSDSLALIDQPDREMINNNSNHYEMPPPKPPRTYQYVDIEPNAYRPRSESQSSNSVFADHVVSVPRPQSQYQSDSVTPDSSSAKQAFYHQHHQQQQQQQQQQQLNNIRMNSIGMSQPMYNTLAGSRVDTKFSARVQPNFANSNLSQPIYQQTPYAVHLQQQQQTKVITNGYGYQTIGNQHHPAMLSNGLPAKTQSKSSYNLVEMTRREQETQLYQPLPIARSRSTTLHSNGNKSLQVQPVSGHTSSLQSNEYSNANYTANVNANALYATNVQPTKSNASRLSVQPINSIYDRFPANQMQKKRIEHSAPCLPEMPKHANNYGVLHRNSSEIMNRPHSNHRMSASNVPPSDSIYEVNHNNYSSNSNKSKSIYANHAQNGNSQLTAQLKQHFANKQMNTSASYNKAPEVSSNNTLINNNNNNNNNTNHNNTRPPAPMQIVRPMHTKAMPPTPDLQSMSIQNELSSVPQMPVRPTIARQPQPTGHRPATHFSSSNRTNTLLDSSLEKQAEVRSTGSIDTNTIDSIKSSNYLNKQQEPEDNNDRKTIKDYQSNLKDDCPQNGFSTTNHVESTRKSGSTFTAISAIFGFSKKKSKKNSVAATGSSGNGAQLNANHISPNTSGNIGLIPPPHSHRFSQPTQWTQV